MPMVEPTSPPPRSGGWRRTVALLSLALAATFALVVNLDTFSPIRQGFGPESPMAIHGRMPFKLAAPVLLQTNGQNVELHFDRAANLPPAADNIADIYCYSLNYVMFPARTFIGDGRQIINGGEQLRRADQLPSSARLRELGVAAVVTYPLDQDGLHNATVTAVR